MKRDKNTMNIIIISAVIIIILIVIGLYYYRKGCDTYNMAAQVEKELAAITPGNTVLVHYTGKLENGTVFDSSVNREPLKVEIGKGQMIPGFENALIGMRLGEAKTISIPAEKGYGAHRPELILTFDKKQLPPNLAIKEGSHVQLTAKDGKSFVAIVKKITGTQAILDANHPLAGKNLVFEIRVEEVK